MSSGKLRGLRPWRPVGKSWRMRYRVGRVGGIPLELHWSMLVLFLVALAISVRQTTASPLLALASFAGLMLAHEYGHAWVARRLRVQVLRIELWPLHGMCWHADCDAYRRSLIAWGGVAVQAGIALVVWPVAYAYTEWRGPDFVNASFALLTGFNVSMIILNLIPIPGLDGSRAWGAFGTAFRRLRAGRRILP